jgi:hypothetical protein
LAAEARYLYKANTLDAGVKKGGQRCAKMGLRKSKLKKVQTSFNCDFVERHHTWTMAHHLKSV